MEDFLLTCEILRNLIQDEQLPPEDFILKTPTYKTSSFISNIFAENAPNKNALSYYIFKKSKEEIIVK